MNVNNVLTSKGGIGKSLVAGILAGYFRDRGQRTLTVDLDPNQPTLTRYQALEVQRIDVTRNGKVDSGLFDQALEKIYGSGLHDGSPRSDLDQVVIDSGAGSYLPFVEYMRREDVMEDFAELGYLHTLHVVLAGGQALEDCVQSLAQLAAHFGQGSRIVVWLNDFFDALPWDTAEAFLGSQLYRHHKALIHGVVQMPDLDPETEGRAFTRFSKANQTFSEALASGSMTYRDSKRLRRIRATYYDQLDPIFAELDTNALAAEAES